MQSFMSFIMEYVEILYSHDFFKYESSANYFFYKETAIMFSSVCD